MGKEKRGREKKSCQAQEGNCHSFKHHNPSAYKSLLSHFPMAPFSYVWYNDAAGPEREREREGPGFARFTSASSHGVSSQVVFSCFSVSFVWLFFFPSPTDKSLIFFFCARPQRRASTAAWLFFLLLLLSFLNVIFAINKRSGLHDLLSDECMERASLIMKMNSNGILCPKETE